MQTVKKRILLGLLLFSNSMAAYAALSIQLAEQLALEQDPVLKANMAQAEAFREQATAEDTLPDPKMKFGLMNFPTDTFERDQEPMTQIQVGIEQMIPRGDMQEIKSRRAIKSSEAATAMTENRRRMVIMQVRNAYLESLYWLSAEKVVRRSQKLFAKLVDITQSQYASGQQRQQDVIRAELELDMLEDRLDEIRTRQDAARASLAKLIGHEQASQPLLETLPEFAALPVSNMHVEQLRQHPLMRNLDARVANSQYGIELARQEYKPNWMVGVTYGFRDGFNPDGSERPDFLSAMVSFDLPLFTGNRQDKNVAASRLRHQASMETREDKLRELQQQLGETLSRWQRLNDRLQRYKQTIVPQSRENARAALFAYQNRRGEFTALMRARITELETDLKQLRLRVDYLKAHARLLYLLGEQQ
jgi:outer membrane protein TolC